MNVRTLLTTVMLMTLACLMVQAASAQTTISTYPDNGSYITVQKNSTAPVFIAYDFNGSVTQATGFQSRQGPPTGCTETVSFGSPIATAAGLYLSCGANAVSGTYQYTLNACSTANSCNSRGYSVTIP